MNNALADSVIEFTEENLIRFKTKKDYTTTIKYLTFDEFIECVLAAKQNNEIHEKDEVIVTDTPVLPANGVYTIFHRSLSTGYQYICMVREAKPFDMEYYDTIYKQCGIPKMLIMVKIFKNVIQSTFIVCVKDPVITEDSIIYYYPYSNVSGFGSVCFGMNNISKIDISSYTALHSLPNIFLSAPNTDHGSINHNLSELKYRPLLETVENKPFPEEWLKPMEYEEKILDKKEIKLMTFKKWLEHFK